MGMFGEVVMTLVTLAAIARGPALLIRGVLWMCRPAVARTQLDLDYAAAQKALKERYDELRHA
jgi:hypothetical protein